MRNRQDSWAFGFASAERCKHAAQKPKPVCRIRASAKLVQQNQCSRSGKSNNVSYCRKIGAKSTYSVNNGFTGFSQHHQLIYKPN
ncbi:hypothetical protein LPJ59_000269, partial [Coemansia sp. RSA 2399]